MSVNNTINDGSILFGSIPVTLSTGSAATYETTDLSLDIDIERYVRKSSLNFPDGKVITMQEKMGTATLHYPTSSTASPVLGDAFSFTMNGISYNCHVEKVGVKRTQAGGAMIAITFSVDIGTVVVSFVPVV